MAKFGRQFRLGERRIELRTLAIEFTGKTSELVGIEIVDRPHMETGATQCVRNGVGLVMFGQESEFVHGPSATARHAAKRHIVVVSICYNARHPFLVDIPFTYFLPHGSVISI